MIAIGSLFLLFRKRAFFGSTFMYRKVEEPPTKGAEIIFTVVGIGGILLGLLAMFNLIET
jgi:hypothetical protein